MIRCRIKRIVCIISKRGVCRVYEKLRNSSEIIVHTSSHRLPWFTQQISDPKLFEVMQGSTVNTRYVEGFDADRNIQFRFSGIPQVVVTKGLRPSFEALLRK